MSPREEDENQLIEDVGIGNVKVVFQRGDRDVAIKLSRQLVYLFTLSSFPLVICLGTYILFHILLPSRHSRLSHLESHLSRGIRHETPQSGSIGATASLHG